MFRIFVKIEVVYKWKKICLIRTADCATLCQCELIKKKLLFNMLIIRFRSISHRNCNI